MKTLTIQPEQEDVRKPLPYPFHVDEAGLIGRQEFWRGDPYRVIGFQRHRAVHRVDIAWSEVWERPELAIGKYLVTSDESGTFSTHQSPIGSVTPNE